MRSIVKTAKTVDEAVALALNELACGMDQVNIEVIKEAKAGFLGFGAQNAVVKVSMKDDPFAKILQDSRQDLHQSAERKQKSDQQKKAGQAASHADQTLSKAKQTTSDRKDEGLEQKKAVQSSHQTGSGQKKSVQSQSQVGLKQKKAAQSHNQTSLDQKKAVQNSNQTSLDQNEETEPSQNSEAWIHQLLKGGRDVTPHDPEEAQSAKEQIDSSELQPEEKPQSFEETEEMHPTFAAGSKDFFESEGEHELADEAFEDQEDEDEDFLKEKRSSSLHDPEEVEAFVQDYMEHLLELMHIDGRPELTLDGETVRVEVVDIDDTDTGILIGRRAETLDAVQYLASIALNRQFNQHYRVFLDVAGYRERRRNAIIKSARRKAQKVQKYHRPISLESMNAYERRIVHTAIQDMEGIYTQSEGREPHRKVVIHFGK